VLAIVVSLDRFQAEANPKRRLVAQRNVAGAFQGALRNCTGSGSDTRSPAGLSATTRRVSPARIWAPGSRARKASRGNRAPSDAGGGAASGGVSSDHQEPPGL